MRRPFPLGVISAYVSGSAARSAVANADMLPVEGSTQPSRSIPARPATFSIWKPIPARPSAAFTACARVRHVLGSSVRDSGFFAGFFPAPLSKRTHAVQRF